MNSEFCECYKNISCHYCGVRTKWAIWKGKKSLLHWVCSECGPKEGHIPKKPGACSRIKT